MKNIFLNIVWFVLYSVNGFAGNDINNSHARSFGPQVAIIDSGFQSKDLEKDLSTSKMYNMTQKKDQAANDMSESVFTPKGSTKTKLNSHGTHVAGIVSSIFYNQYDKLDIIVPYKKSDIIVPFKISVNRVKTSCFIEALGIICNDDRIKIINLSWRLGHIDHPFHKEYCEAFKKVVSAGTGKIIVLSAGNEPVTWGEKEYHKNIIEIAQQLKGRLLIVGAHNNENKLADFSARGSELISDYFISAPGVMINSTVPIEINKNGFAEMSGTSMSAPYVSGLLLRLLYINRNLSVDEASEIVRRTANPVYLCHVSRKLDYNFGRGIVNIFEAEKEAKKHAFKIPYKKRMLNINTISPKMKFKNFLRLFIFLLTYSQGKNDPNKIELLLGNTFDDCEQNLINLYDKIKLKAQFNISNCVCSGLDHCEKNFKDARSELIEIFYQNSSSALRSCTLEFEDKAVFKIISKHNNDTGDAISQFNIHCKDLLEKNRIKDLLEKNRIFLEKVTENLVFFSFFSLCTIKILIYSNSYLNWL